MVGSVLFQREISEKDNIGFCETPALFVDEQDDFDIAENNFCPINMQTNFRTTINQSHIRVCVL